MSGWIKLHRSLTDWEWYDDINTKTLFFHLLLTANHADKKWRGMTVPRGSRWTSLDILSAETGLSVRMIRTSLNKLKSTGELTDKGQATGKVRGRMIAISKYDYYQGDDKQATNREANKRQTNDKQTTGNKNDKNDKNKDIGDKSPAKDSVELVNQIFISGGVSKDQISEIRSIRKNNKGGKITERVAKGLLKEFIAAGQLGWTLENMLTEWESRGWKSFKADWLKSPVSSGYKTANQERSESAARTFDPEVNRQMLEGL